MLTLREHALYARTLIGDCGGLEEASKAVHEAKRRDADAGVAERSAGLSVNTLSTYQNPTRGETMPARIIDILEDYCGGNAYSSALANQHAPAKPQVSIDEAACAFTEAAAEYQALARKAKADGKFSVAERDALARAVTEAEQLLEQAKATLRELDTPADTGARLRAL
jgi:hypothetical protein